MVTYDILIVEDNTNDMELAKLAAKFMVPHESEQRLHCHTTETLAGAEKIVGEQHIDGVLLDLNLPNGKGADTVRRCRTFCPDKAIVAISGHGDDMRNEVMAFGADSFMTKPPDYRGVMKELLTQIEKRRLPIAGLMTA